MSDQDTATYRLLKGTHGRMEADPRNPGSKTNVIYQGHPTKGDLIDLTPAEVAAFKPDVDGPRIEPYHPTEETHNLDFSFVADEAVEKVVGLVRSTADPDHLQAILAAEKAGDGRVTITRAVEVRLNKLREAAGDED